MDNINRGVLVFLEQRDNEVAKVSLELLGKGKELADRLGVPLLAAVLGSRTDACAKEAVSHGADRVYAVEDPKLHLFRSDLYTKGLAAVIRSTLPEIVLIGATSIGRDIAPRIAARLHTGLTADCTGLAIEEGTNLLLMTRPAFGGNLMATIACPDHRPQMSTVRPGVMVMPAADPSRRGEILPFAVPFLPEDEEVEILETVKEPVRKVNIEDAKVLVSAGRGIGGPEHMDIVYGLADELKAEVSGSRAVVEAGWLAKDRQVGQTGKTVRPDVYVAVGISGAIQHVSGMEGSKTIIAVNPNPDAPIFKVADLGLVGDAEKILPLVTRQIRALKEGK